MSTPNMQGMPAPQPKKSNTGLIIGIVVVVLLCCCCVVIVAGGYYVRMQANKAIESVNQQLTALPDTLLTAMPELTSMPEAPSVPGSPDATAEPGDVPTVAVPSDLVPQGGLGDDVQRAQAWASSLLTVITAGCNVPVAKDTKIEVTQQPDSKGVWVERWTIACQGSSDVKVDVTYTPGDNGVTDVKAEIVK